jgi:hypothetical protein
MSRMEEATVKLQRSLRQKILRDENVKRWERAAVEGEAGSTGAPHDSEGNSASKKPPVLVGAAAGVINAISRGPSSIVSHSSSK